ncbi:MAG: hypothetical protein KA392_00890, partial [Candidatus Obscuribacter sp.]|nr:hypothetical protein [Candidatus Obscuribacter sp.]MBP7578564.1 hypothetical protein [Candidatus Obscuribacter sp.]
MQNAKVNAPRVTRSMQSVLVWLAGAGLLLAIQPALAAGLSATQLDNVTLDAPDMEGDGTHKLTFTNSAHKHEYG